MKSRRSLPVLIIFSIIPLIVLALIFETFFRFYFYEILENKYTSVQLQNRYSESDFIKEINIEGKEYYYSDFYPVKYYLNAEYKKGKYILKDKPDNVHRFFSFGGSSTAGSPFGHWGSFSRFLQDSLESISKENTIVETINFGTSGGTVNRARFILEKVAKLKPDTIIIYAGHNEICDALLYKTFFDKKINNFSSLLSKYSYFYRSLTLLYLNASSEVVAAGDKPFNTHQCPRKKTLITNRQETDQIKINYFNNLVSIIKIAEKYNIDVVLVEQLSNLFTLPEDYDVQGNSRPGMDRTRIVPEYAKNIENALIVGDLDIVRKLATDLLSRDQDNPFAYFYLGIIDLVNKKQKSAGNYLYKAIEYDRRPLRYRPSYSDILMELAKTYDHVYMINLKEKIKNIIEDELVDGRLVVDVMHPTIELNKYISNQIVEQYYIKNQDNYKLFNMKEFKRENVWNPFKEIKYYQFICKRYYKIAEWSDCIKKAKNEYFVEDTAYSRISKRRSSRVWENLFYYGLVNNNELSIKSANDIYSAPSIRKYLGTTSNK